MTKIVHLDDSNVGPKAILGQAAELDPDAVVVCLRINGAWCTLWATADAGGSDLGPDDAAQRREREHLMTARALTLAPSTNVASASYDEEMMEMTVVFYSGGTYTYQGVNKETAFGLENAPSPGGFIHRFVKGRFPST